MNEKKEYLKAKIEELETNSKIKILGTFIGASITLRKVTSLELILKRISRVMCLEARAVFWLDGGTISLSY
jgi:hypothetical protein